MDNNNTYQWFRSASGRWTNELRKNNEVVATVSYAGEYNPKAYVEINGQNLVIQREAKLFGSSVIINDEETGNRVCIVKNMKWYAIAKGVICFEDGTAYKWQICNYPAITLRIESSEDTRIAEYRLNDQNDRFNIHANDIKMDAAIFHLLLVIGWYCAPKLSTVDYAMPNASQLITQNLEYAF